MSNNMPETIFRELMEKLTAAGLPQQQAQDFAEKCCGYQDAYPLIYEVFDDQKMPSDDCFKTLAEAHKIHMSGSFWSNQPTQLEFIHFYLKMPYSDVISTKAATARIFGCGEAEIEAVYAADPEWLLITEDNVNAFAAFLGEYFQDTDLNWYIYKKAALLGLENTSFRIHKVMEMLGREIGEAVIRNDMQEDGFLFYRLYTRPVECIAYMLERGLTPAQVCGLLKSQPQILLLYRGRSEQKYIDAMIEKYINGK